MVCQSRQDKLFLFWRGHRWRLASNLWHQAANWYCIRGFQHLQLQKHQQGKKYQKLQSSLIETAVISTCLALEFVHCCPWFWMTACIVPIQYVTQLKFVNHAYRLLLLFFHDTVWFGPSRAWTKCRNVMWQEVWVPFLVSVFRWHCYRKLKRCLTWTDSKWLDLVRFKSEWFSNWTSWTGSQSPHCKWVAMVSCWSPGTAKSQSVCWQVFCFTPAAMFGMVLFRAVSQLVLVLSLH